MNDINFIRAISKTITWEGGFTNGKNQVSDMPTNMGVQQRTLDRYNACYPEKNYPANVRALTDAQAAQIYYDIYWRSTRIPEINNARIQDAAFDMNVMSGELLMVKTIQRALNKYLGSNLATDGVMGARTVATINSIPDDKIAGFITTLQDVRIASMRRMANWPTAQNGWMRRVMCY